MAIDAEVFTVDAGFVTSNNNETCFCLDAFFESKLIDNDSVDQKLRDECFAAVKVFPTP